jgi:hypothetical protein
MVAGFQLRTRTFVHKMAKENKGKPRGNGLRRVIAGNAEAARP